MAAFVNIAIAEACPARFCSPPRTETENTKRSFLLNPAKLFRVNFPVTLYNNGNVRSAKNGRKKSSKSFQTYCLCAAVIRRRIFSY